MEIYNLSLHASREFNMDMKVYIALDAPRFCSKEQFTQWRARVIEYVNAKQIPMNGNGSDKNYSVVYVPQAVTEEDSEISSVPDDNVLFITKRCDDFDSSKSFVHDLEVPGNYTIVVMHDLGNVIPHHEKPFEDVVSASSRILRITFLLFVGFVASLYVLRANPNSVIGM